MNNIKKLKKVFSEVLNINNNLINDETHYEGLNWDSLSHMALISSIEDCFDLMLDTDEIIELSTFKKAKEILSNHGVSFESNPKK
jgi:acyl carrier protein